MPPPMYSDDDPVPAISAGCAHCGFIFALNLELDCPRCHKRGVAWATLTENMPCDVIEPGAQEEIEWLEKYIANAKELHDVQTTAEQIQEAPSIKA